MMADPTEHPSFYGKILLKYHQCHSFPFVFGYLSKYRPDTINSTRGIPNKDDFATAFSYAEVVSIASVMTVICLLTITGNAFVMLSFIMDKKLQTLNNYFLLSLAVSDILVGAFSIPLYTQYLLRGKWTLGRVICDMWLSQDYTSGNASFFNLLMIGFDRYFSVISPLQYRARRTGKRVALMISGVWIVSILSWTPWIYAWPHIEGRRTVPEDDCYIQFLETNFYMTAITSVLFSYLPVLILLVLYYKIWRETKKREKYLADMETGCQIEYSCMQKNFGGMHWKRRAKLLLPCYSKQDKATQSNSKVVDEALKSIEAALLKETTDVSIGGEAVFGNTLNDEKQENHFEETTCIQRFPDFNPDHNTPSVESTQPKPAFRNKVGCKSDSKAARMLTTILLAFIITTIPYSVIVIVKNLDSTHSIIPDVVWHLFYTLVYVNSTINPVCYALANKNFRRTYWKIISCSWSKRKSRVVYSSDNYFNKSLESSRNSQNMKNETSCL